MAHIIKIGLKATYGYVVSYNLKRLLKIWHHCWFFVDNLTATKCNFHCF